MIDLYLPVFRSLNSREVDYLVIGGIAAVAHGVPRATFDLDLLIDATPGNARSLLDALAEAGMGTAALTSAEELLAHEITVFADRIRIDVQTETPGITFSSAASRRMIVDYEGVAVPFLSREDLIAAKRASGRPVDEEDVRILLGET